MGKDRLAEFKPFFYPASIAVVGASEDRAKFGTHLLRAIQRFGFKGKLYPVNLQGKEVYGLKIYPSLAAISGEVDLAYICIPAPAVPGMVKECQDKGVRAVVVNTSNFSELGTPEGKRLEAELAGQVGKGLRLIGPNCFGIYCPAGGVTQLPGATYPRESGPVGFVSQSGGLSVEVCRLTWSYGIRLSKAVSYGNACDVTELDILEYMAQDPETKIIAAYIEGVKNGRRFLELVREISRKKPLVIWKGGLTPAGARATMSHTASLAGSEAVWAAVFSQTSAIRVNTLEELLDTVSALCHLPPQVDRRVAVVCGGGGTSVAASDACERAGLELSLPDKELQQRLRGILGVPGSSVRNPIDTGNPFPSSAVLSGLLETLATSGQVANFIIDRLNLSSTMRRLTESFEEVPEDPDLPDAPIRFKHRFGKPVMVVLREGGDKPEALSRQVEMHRLRHLYLSQGIPVYPTLERAALALSRVIQYYRQR